MGDKLIGGLTQNAIENLKRKHGKLKLCTVGEDKHFWFKKPDMATVSAAANVMDSDVMESNKIYFRNCLVEGDVTAEDNVDVFMALLPYLNQLIEVEVVTVKNF